MDATTEKQIEDMIRMHGLETVRKHLSVLLGQANWADWQRLDSWITNTANKIKREDGIK